MDDINTLEYWDGKHQAEGLDTWRIYPATNDIMAANIPNKSKVLELGCGTGLLAKRLIWKGCNYLGLDISPEAIKLAKKRVGLNPRIKFMQAKLPPIPTKERFDWIAAAHFLEHFPNPEVILKDCKKHAKNAIFIVPDNILGPEECAEHFHKFTPESLRELLEKHYKEVIIVQFIEQFETPKINIRLPTIAAICRRRKRWV